MGDPGKWLGIDTPILGKVVKMDKDGRNS